MKVVQKIIAIIVLAVFFLGGHAVAFQAEFVGSVKTGLSAPTSIVAGDDYLVVLEPFDDRITLFTADGQVSHRVDFTGDAMGLARLADSRYVYCDRRLKNVVMIDLEQKEQEAFLNLPDLLIDPVDICVDGSRCYILDAGRREILIADLSGRLDRQLALNVPAETAIGFPAGLAVDHNKKVFYVFDQLTSRVLVFNHQGEYSGSFCSFGAGEGTITRGGGIACDRSGYVYIADRYQGRVAVFNPEGNFITHLDPLALGGSRWNIPTGVTVDDQDLLYVAATEGRRIDIYHLEKATSPGGILTASPVYPINYDTVTVDGLHLMARLAGVTEPVEITGFDFQMARGSDTTMPFTQVMDVTPTGGGGDDPENQEVMAIWYPDAELVAEELYGWQVRIHAADRRGAWSSWQWFRTAAVPTDYYLEQNYPNPFNPRTTLSFVLATGTDATVTIYDLLGREVWRHAFDRLSPGRHEITWDGTDSGGQPVGSGVYFYRLNAGGSVQTRKMVLLK